MRTRFIILILFLMHSLPAIAQADDLQPNEEPMRAAIRKAIVLLDAASAGSANKRKCFTCHNQALPVMALAEAKNRGYEVDAENFTRQIKHTVDHLKRGRKSYLEGKGQGGRVLTAGYAMWTLEAGAWQADETTAAVNSFLLSYQKDADHWAHPGNRPPSSGSDFTTTYVALRALEHFGTDEQQQSITARRDVVRGWLLKAEPKDTEDRVFRLRSMKYADVEEPQIRTAAEVLLNEQHEDGGWAQLPDGTSDAYATASVLTAFLRTESLGVDSDGCRRAVKFLLDTQQGDGSWQVATRAKPFQTYYETGFPHGKDQFISVTATSWALIALLLAGA